MADTLGYLSATFLLLFAALPKSLGWSKAASWSPSCMVLFVVHMYHISTMATYGTVCTAALCFWSR